MEMHVRPLSRDAKYGLRQIKGSQEAWARPKSQENISLEAVFKRVGMPEPTQGERADGRRGWGT